MLGRKEQAAKILYIWAFGRCGSTLLARMLGQTPRFFYAGEPKYVWGKYFADEEPYGDFGEIDL